MNCNCVTLDIPQNLLVIPLPNPRSALSQDSMLTLNVYVVGDVFKGKNTRKYMLTVPQLSLSESMLVPFPQTPLFTRVLVVTKLGVVGFVCIREMSPTTLLFLM
jgi:hypothetical protein